MIIRGAEEKVKYALRILKDVKNAALPEVHPTDCGACQFQTCHLWAHAHEASHTTRMRA